MAWSFVSCCCSRRNGSAWCRTRGTSCQTPGRCFVHYATFHMPPEPDGFYQYNALQQLAYFGVVFILAPLAIVTGPRCRRR